MQGSQKRKPSGFEPLPKRFIPCNHPQHNPPGHLYIPPGSQFRHVCPGCGAEMILRPAFIHWMESSEQIVTFKEWADKVTAKYDPENCQIQCYGG
jgi:hypothetical protein